MSFTKFALTVSAAALLVSPALAQKSKDTLRVGVSQPISIVDIILNPQPQTTLMTSVVFDSLIHYDADSRSFRPLLAESWKRIDAKTLEFKLKRGIKFHDGSDFDADDVIYTVKYATDPKVKFRFRGTRYGWIKEAQKIDSHTVRIVGKGVYAPALTAMAISTPIFPSDHHSKLADKRQFGKAPVATGPFRVTSVNSARGVTMVKFDGYKHGGSVKPAAQVSVIKITPDPDAQTQVAKMMTAQQDMMYEVQKDQAEDLAKNPALKVTVTPTVQFSYIYPDAADRSGVGYFKDKRVRLAMFHAVDRKAMAKALLPKEVWNEPLPTSMCHKWLIGCDHDVKAPEYDPAKAKRLLAEAGLAGGFDVKLTVWGAAKAAAEAAAGYMRKVGIRASVDAVTFGVYNRKRSQSKVQTFVSFWDNGGAQPDVNTTAGFFFLPGARNYNHDKVLSGLVLEGRKIYDVPARTKIYRKIFNRAVTEAYFFPLLSIPAIVVHDKDLVLQGGHKSPKGFLFNRINWKK